MLTAQSLILLAVAYLLGSIPFGLLLTRLCGLGDVRQIGSGNIGATNVLRTGRRGLAVLTLLLDGAKGFFAAWLAGYYGHAPSLIAWAGIAAVLGHIFPVWLRFKGGKGVATTIGVLLAMHLLVGLAVCMLWLAVFAFTRISSLSAILSIGFAWVVAFLLHDYATTLSALALGLLIIFTHRHNIRRLAQGKELTFRAV